MLSDNLKLHLKLDDVTITGDNVKIKDISGNGKDIDGSVTGNPKVVDDELFGKCLSFDGKSYIELVLPLPIAKPVQICQVHSKVLWKFSLNQIISNSITLPKFLT